MSAQPLWSVPPEDSDWVKRIAIAVDEFVQHPAIIARFHELLRQWLAGHVAANSKDGVIHIPPDRAMSLPEKYAALSAIHDELCSSDAPKISPWKPNLDWPKEQEAQFIEGISSFGVLRNRVKKIKDADRKRLFRALADVRRDLERLRLVQSDGRANSPHLHRPTPDDFPARILRNFLARSGGSRPTGSRQPARQEPQNQSSENEQAAIPIDEAIQSLGEQDRRVLRTIHDFECAPYPNAPKKLEGIDEPIASRSSPISPVPDYIICGVAWPKNPEGSLRVLKELGLIRQPQGRHLNYVHCILPDGRTLKAEWKTKPESKEEIQFWESAPKDEHSLWISVSINDVGEFGSFGRDEPDKPNAYTLTPFGLRVARQLSAAVSDSKPDPRTGEIKRAKSAGQERRSWTQPEVDAEIRNLVSGCAKTIKQLRAKIQNEDAVAKKEARRNFGRNSIAKRLKCPQAMVSKSAPWKAIAGQLELIGKVPGASKVRRIGLEMADEIASEQEWKALEREQARELQAERRRTRRRDS